MRVLIFYLLSLLLISFFAGSVSAQNADKFINIVNPVRISSYIKDPLGSLNAQYDEVKKRNLPATWLLTYDVIENDSLVSTLKGMDDNQELGLFMEITPGFAESSNVAFNKTDSWHRANSLFLSGYSQENRRQFIDEIFNKFKEKFAFYPTSVGAWWIDSYSLEYMQKKYGVSANLTCADQFETDGYHLWGQYWGVPFYPNKFHAGIPAKDKDSKVDVVTIQWAPRDPINGYYSSLYSTQDYFNINLGLDYFEKLIKFYSESREDFGQIAFGLEGDLGKESYKGIYAKELDLVKSLRESGDYQVTTMNNFSNWFREKFKDSNPNYFLSSDDFLGTPQKAMWYQSPNYRIGINFNKQEENLTIIDLRAYLNNFYEPFYLTPNFLIDLYINTPSVIDSFSNPISKWEIGSLKLKEIENKNESIILNFEDGKKISLNSDSIIFENFNQLTLPGEIKNSPKLDIKKEKDTLIINPKKAFPYEAEGFTFSDLSIPATYFLWRPKIQTLGLAVIFFILAATFFTIFFTKGKKEFKVKIIAAFYLIIIFIGGYLFLSNRQTYLVNHAEIDALEHLEALPPGKIAVVKGGCLICKWQTKYPPGAFANKKGYVSKFSKKPIVYNSSVFQAKTRPEGKAELNKLGVKYIYVVKYEGYLEEVPFSPGDLNVEKIYENAHSQIWRLKDG